MEHTWLDRQAYPFASRSISVDGYRQHYIDEGRGEVLLFVHGTPSWSFEFRHLILKLRSQYRCIAADHIGFGLSDQPAGYAHSTVRHGQVLENLVSTLGLTNITLVVHDFGGPIGLSVAIRRPELIKRIVVLNSWLWSTAEEPAFKKMAPLLRSWLLPALYTWLNFPLRVLLPQSFHQKPAAAVIRQYRMPFARLADRRGPLAFARSLVHDQDWFETLWKRRHALFHKPVLIIWGMQDKMLPPAFAAKFHWGFPGSRLVTVDAAGHFPHEEEPNYVLACMQRFLDDRGDENADEVC